MLKAVSSGGIPTPVSFGGTGSATGNGILGRAPTMVTFGDSIIAQQQFILANTLQVGSAATPMVSGSFDASYNVGFVERAKIILGQPWNHVAAQGVSGDNTAMMLARVGNVTAYKPSFVIMNGGTNDPSGGLGSPQTTAQSIANLKAIYAALIAAGCVVIDTTITPVASDNQAAILQKSTINDFKMDYAAKNTGVYCFDLCSLMLDTSSLTNSYGTPISSQVKDGTHENGNGGRVAGIGFAAWLKQMGLVNTRLQRRSSRNSDGSANGDTTEILFNPLFIQGTGGTLNGSGSTSVAQGWKVYSSGGITATASIVTRASMANTFPNLFADGEQGFLQHIGVSGATSVGDTTTLQSNASTAAIGGTGPYVMECEVAINVTSGTLNTAQISQFMNLSSGNCSVYANATDGSGAANIIQGDTSNSFYGVIRTNPFYPPTTLSNSNAFLQVNTSVAGACDIYVGNFSQRILQA